MVETRQVSGVGPAGSFVPGGILRPVVASALFFMIVAGVVYPLVTTLAAQILFPEQAQGSLIERDRVRVGSHLIGQPFAQPRYFHGRPSATTAPDPADPAKTVDQPYDGASSGASNQGALSRAWLAAVAARVQAYRKENGLAADAQVPVDAVTASGSGLDPDISPENARLQAPRIARARGLSVETILSMINRHLLGRQFGLLGEVRINVLELNLALDEAAMARPSVK
jgi:K+-transporting ATPase ATPase C chain